MKLKIKTEDSEQEFAVADDCTYEAYSFAKNNQGENSAGMAIKLENGGVLFIGNDILTRSIITIGS